MKKDSQNPIKMRVRNGDGTIYYTFAHWPTNQIDGVDFICVNKNPPAPTVTQQTHWMRKDTLEKVRG